VRFSWSTSMAFAVASAAAYLLVVPLALCRLASPFEGSTDGATYYVDSSEGKDLNTGVSPGAAWKSLEKVNARTFQPGDRILLKWSSVWQGQLWPKGSGREGQPITVGMYGGGVRPAIHGGGMFGDVVLLKNQEYWEIENLEITNTGRERAARRGVHVALENFGEAHHIYLRSLTIHDVNGVDNVKPNGGINYTSVGHHKPSRFVDLRIENNDVYHLDRSGIFGWSDRWERSKWYASLDVVVRGNQLHDIDGHGIVVVATDGSTPAVSRTIDGHPSAQPRFAKRVWRITEEPAVPRELFVMGFDNIHLSQYILPPLTTIRDVIDRTWRLAFQALLQDARREIPNPKGTEYVLKASFILRDSTA
jgi:hypothetical protein